MAVGLRVKLQGDKAFRDAIGRLTLPGAKAAYRAALTEAAKFVIGKSKSDYLSGQMLRRRSGDLQKSLKAHRPSFAHGGASVAIGSALPQAAPLHFGWPKHNLRASPYLQTPLERHTDDIARIFVEEFERETARVT